MTFTFKVFCAECKAEYTQTIKNHEFKPNCCGMCGSDWIAVKQLDSKEDSPVDYGRCQRCGSCLTGIGYCTHKVCGFFNHSQHCVRGWDGHPDKAVNAWCTC